MTTEAVGNKTTPPAAFTAPRLPFQDRKMHEHKELFGSTLCAGLACRSLFYPCAGNDWSVVLNLFAEHIDSFMFVDTQYQFDRIRPIEVAGLELLPASTHLRGEAYSPLERIPSYGRRHRHVEPAWLEETYLHQGSGRHIKVTRRRGFGQYALREIPDGSLGVFFHRGDSMGEGGSDAWFLANRRRNHPPLSHLFRTLKRKLAYPALIVSDGSNTDFGPLKEAAQDYERAPDRFELEGLSWVRAGAIAEDGRRKTVIWRVTV